LIPQEPTPPGRVYASAPGKVLWIGSYTVLLGGISHSIAINRRVRCEVWESEDYLFETPYGVFRYPGNDLIKSVIDVLTQDLGELKKFRARLFNDHGFEVHGKKTGLGSSSASTVALTAAILGLHKGAVNLKDVYRYSQLANYLRQGGVGSGFDIATAVYGSSVYKKFSDIRLLDSYVEPLGIGNKYKMLMGFTGISANTPSLVREFLRAIEARSLKEDIHEVEVENSTAIKLLREGRLDEAAIHVRIARTRLERSLDSLGLNFFKLASKFINEAERRGALLSLSPGAGGGDSVFAIGEDLENVKKVWGDMGLHVIEVEEDQGLRLES